jgi:putative membrane protein insertion efficiency factor
MPSETSPVAKALLKVITSYQRLMAGRPSPCRFYPSCSNFAVEAIEVHGALRGTGLALRRLGRCRPLGPHGVDLVPEPKKARSTHS